MMADEFGVNREMIHQILVEDLGKRKVATQFVLHSLSDDQRHECVQYAKDIIKTAHRNKNSLNSIVAEDETWCFCYDPTTKRLISVSQISPDLTFHEIKGSVNFLISSFFLNSGKE